MKIVSSTNFCQSLRGTNVATGCVFTNTNNVKIILGGDIYFSVSVYPSILDGYKVTLNTDYARYYDVGNSVLISFVTNSGGYAHFIGNILNIFSNNEFVVQSVSLTALITGSHIDYNKQYEGIISTPNVGNIVKHIYLKTSLYATDLDNVSNVTLNTTRFYSSVSDALLNTSETTAVSSKPATLISSDFDRYSAPVYIGLNVVLTNTFYDTVTNMFVSHFAINCTFGHSYNKLYFLTQTIENTHYGLSYPDNRQYAHLAVPIDIETPELTGLDTYKFYYELEFTRYDNNAVPEHSIVYQNETTLNSTPYFNEKFNSQAPDYDIELIYEDIDFNTFGYTNTLRFEFKNAKVPINLFAYNKDYITFFEKKEDYNPFVDTFNELRIISYSRDNTPVINNHFTDFYNYVSTPIVQNITFTPITPTTFQVTFEFNPSLYNTGLGTYAIHGFTLYYVNEWIRDLYLFLGLPNSNNAIQSHLLYKKTNDYYLENLNSLRLHFSNPIMYWNSRRMCNNATPTPPYEFRYGSHSNTAPLFANVHLFSIRCFKTLKDNVTPVNDSKIRYKQLRVVWLKGNDEFFTNPSMHPLGTTPKTDAYFYTKQYLNELIETAPILYQTVYDLLGTTSGTGVAYQGLPSHPDTEFKRFSEISDANAVLIPNYEYRFGRDTAWTAYAPVSFLLSDVVYLFTSAFYEMDNETELNIPNRSHFLTFTETHGGYNHSHPHYQKYASNIVNDYQISNNAKMNLVIPVIVITYDYDGIPFTETLTPLHYTYEELTEFKTLQNCYPACVYHDKNTGGVYDFFVFSREPISAYPDADPQLQFTTSLGVFTSAGVNALENDTIVINATNPSYVYNVNNPILGQLYTKLTPSILGATLVKKDSNRDLSNKTCFEFVPVASQFVQDSNGINIITPFLQYEIPNVEVGSYYLYVYIGTTYHKSTEAVQSTYTYLSGGTTYTPDNPIGFSFSFAFPPSVGILDVATMRIPINVVKTVSNTPTTYTDTCCEGNFIEKYVNLTIDGYTTQTKDDTILLFHDKTAPLICTIDYGTGTFINTILPTILENYIIYITGASVMEHLYAVPLSVLLGSYYNNPSYDCLTITIPKNPPIIVYNKTKRVKSICDIVNTVGSNSFINYKGIRMYGNNRKKQRLTLIDFMQKDDNGGLSTNSEQIQLNRVSEQYSYNKTVQRSIEIVVPNFNVVYNYIDLIVLMQDVCSLSLQGSSKFGNGTFEVALSNFDATYYGNSSFGDIELNFKEKYNAFIT